MLNVVPEEMEWYVTGKLFCRATVMGRRAAADGDESDNCTRQGLELKSDDMLPKLLARIEIKLIVIADDIDDDDAEGTVMLAGAMT